MDKRAENLHDNGVLTKEQNRLVTDKEVDGPVDPVYLRRMLGAEDEAYNRRRRAANRYLQDRSEQGVGTLAGMGYNFQDQDRYAAESDLSVLWSRQPSSV